MVLKRKIWQVACVAEREIQEPMADKIVNLEPKLCSCFFWALFTFNKYPEFLTYVVICILEAVGLWKTDFEQSLWWSVEQLVFNVALLVQFRCHFVVSLVWDMLNLDRIWEGPLCWEKELDSFRQCLLPFSAECCMYWSIKLKLFLSYCVGVKFGVFHQENTD